MLHASRFFSGCHENKTAAFLTKMFCFKCLTKPPHPPPTFDLHQAWSSSCNDESKLVSAAVLSCDVVIPFTVWGSLSVIIKIINVSPGSSALFCCGSVCLFSDWLESYIRVPVNHFSFTNYTTHFTSCAAALHTTLQYANGWLFSPPFRKWDEITWEEQKTFNRVALFCHLPPR